MVAKPHTELRPDICWDYYSSLYILAALAPQEVSESGRMIAFCRFRLGVETHHSQHDHIYNLSL